MTGSKEGKKVACARDGCNEEFVPFRHKRFCSRKCQKKQWDTEHYDERREYDQQRYEEINHRLQLIVLERDGWKCTRCGEPLETGNAFNCVHHANYDFTTDEEELAVMYSECRKCHVVVEHGFFGENHPAAKLTDIEVEEIRALDDTGEISQRVLARLYSVNQSQISRIVNYNSRDINVTPTPE